MRLSVLLVLVGGFSLGIGIGTVWSVSSAVVVLLLVLSVALGMVRRKNAGSNFAPRLLYVGLCFATVALGLWRAELAQLTPTALATQVEQTIELTGVVSREPDVREQQQLLYVKTNTDTVLVSTDRHVQVQYGDRVTAAGTLQVPASFTTDLGREFNYPGYLQARGVQYQMSFAEVVVTEQGQGNFIVGNLLAAKHSFMAALEQTVPEPYVGLGEGLLLGEKRALGEDISEQFRLTGLTHIVVLSGYNVMLVVAFCLYIFSFIFGLRGRIVAGVIAIIAFALVVGLSATVVRASIMAVMVLVAQATGRRYDVLRALLLAGTLMLIINPYLLLFDIGFQLSFMATLGLVLFAPAFESTIASKGVTTLRGFLLATVVTQIAVLPLLIYHIGQVSIIAVLANVLVLPVVPVAMLLTFLSGTAALVHVTLALPLAFLAQLSLSYILLVTDLLARVPFAAVTTPEIPGWGVVALYVLGLSGYYWWHNRDTPTMVGWEIVEEDDGVVNTKKAQQAKPAAPPPDDVPPIFFR